MQRREYKQGAVIVTKDTVWQSLCIVSYGVLVGSALSDERKIEVIRLAPGDYFGEMGCSPGNRVALEYPAPALRATPAPRPASMRLRFRSGI